MAANGIEDETYSVIFSSLKHPVRRRILRMLAEKPLAFSEIHETLSIDSGHLSYHLENLGELVVHDSEGKYMLSSIGVAAVKLMSGVEEQPQKPPKNQSHSNRRVASKVLSILIATALIVASFYLTTVTNLTASATLNQDNQKPVDITVNPGKSFEFNVGLTQWIGPLPVGSTYTGVYLAPDPPDYNFLLPPSSNRHSFSVASISVDLVLNSSDFQQPNTDQWPIGLANNSTLTVIKPDGVRVNVPIHAAYGPVYSATDPWTWGGLDHFVSSTIQVTVTESYYYHFIINNTGQSSWNGTLLPHVQWQEFEKPYVGYGAIGIAIGVAYIAFIGVETFIERPKTKS
jgi:hypothetical protein